MFEGRVRPSGHRFAQRRPSDSDHLGVGPGGVGQRSEHCSTVSEPTTLTRGDRAGTCSRMAEDRRTRSSRDPGDYSLRIQRPSAFRNHGCRSCRVMPHAGLRDSHSPIDLIAKAFESRWGHHTYLHSSSPSVMTTEIIASCCAGQLRLSVSGRSGPRPAPAGPEGEEGR